ncbi:MAG: SdrD B-like domain-containing protein [Bacteroidota bacterium]
MFFASVRTITLLSATVVLLAFSQKSSFFEKAIAVLEGKAKRQLSHHLSTIQSTYFSPGATCVGLAADAIGGNVWEDINFDGDKSNESSVYGVSGITVTLFGATGQVATTTTNSDGNYLFSGLTESRYRVEFTVPNSMQVFTKGTKSGTNSQTTVQFVTPGNCADLGVGNPGRYCDATPSLITPCFISGEPSLNGSSAIGDVLVSYPYTANATKSDVRTLAYNRQIGSTWGVAYAKTSKNIFAAAMMKRHAGFGPLGIGGIYRVNYNNPNSPIVSNWLDLSAAGVNVGTNPRTYTLPATSHDSSKDPAGFDAVGKIGLGDMDISEDEKTLYVLNLNNNGSLVEIDIATKAVTNNIPIPNPGCGVAGDVRPWGLSIYKDDVYVGLVCSGESAGGGDMQFFVSKYDGSNFTTVLNESLNYEKGFVHLNYNKPDAPELCKNWETWVSDFDDIHTAGASREGPRWCRPQPILSDIEFDNDGSMVLAFMDRTGHQTGYLQAHTHPDSTILGNGYVGGDLLRAYNNSGTFVLESGGTTLNGGGCGTNNLAGAVNADTVLQGPGGGEYYCGEKFDLIHQETSLGGIVLSPNDNLLAINVMDPLEYYTGGTMWMDNTTGQTDRAFELYGSHLPLSGAQTAPGTFGKAAGLGDLELTCAPAPLEIGNYVWNDENSDGIQNPNEPGIDGLTVELIKNGVKIATTTTQNGGQYYFSADGTANQTWETTGDQVLPNMAYCVRINLNEAGLNGASVTTKDSDTSTNGDSRDNDAMEVNGYAQVCLTTGGSGEVMHEADFGFSSNLCLGDYVWVDKNADGVQDDDEAGISGITVELVKDNAVVATTTTNAQGKYFFTVDGAAGQTWTTSGDQVKPQMDYTIRINLAQAPLGKSKLTDRDQTDDLKDSDAMVNGSYAEITLRSGNPGTSDHHYDFGFQPSLCVGNLVWLDANNSGTLDGTETGIANVEVILFKVGGDGTKGVGNDVEVSRDTTNTDGKYLFADLDEGVYFVKVNDGIPANLASSTGTGKDGSGTSTYEPGRTTSTDLDNDDNGTQMGNMVMSDTFTLAFCAEPINDGDDDTNTNFTVDFGFTPCLSVGNLIFTDVNNDGQRNPAEDPISGVEVQLYQLGPDGQKSADDVLVKSDTTEANGLYLFDGLKPGKYYVKLNDGIPANMVSATGEGLQTSTGNGPNEPGPNPDTNTTDNDDNGTQMGTMIMSEVFMLTIDGEPTNDGDNDPNTDLSVDFALIELLSLGNLVWSDMDNDGIKGKGEKGVAGVEAILYQLGPDNQKGTADDVVLARDTTDTDGHYLFTQLLPGDYYVKLGHGVPFGFGSSTGEGIMDVDGVGKFEPAPDPDNDQNDDDNGDQMGYMIMSQVVSLSLNGEPTNDGNKNDNSNLTVDFGLFQLLRLGNLVWEDFDNDGYKDTDEPGIPNVEAILYQVGPDGQKGTADDVEIKRDTTDTDGHYIFVQLLPGDYYVKLNSGIDNFSSSTGEGIDQVTGNGNFETAPDPDNDVDNEDNGTQMGFMVMSELITLEFMGEPAFEDNFINSNFTLDFGLFQPLALGNLVWNDQNNNGIREDNEPGFGGIQVVLFDAGPDGQKDDSDKEVARTVTNGNGNYNFPNLKPGNYYVKLNNVPSELTSSTGAGSGELGGSGPYEPGVPAENDINSDDNGTQMGNMVMSDVVKLQLYAESITDGDSDRKTNLTVDFGLLKVNQIKIHNPCTCLDNASSPTANDGQFSETVTILSNQSGQNWTVSSVNGAFNASGERVVIGDAATEMGTEDGQFRYVFDLRHVDGQGYAIQFTNGTNQLTVSNRCYYSQSCRLSTTSTCVDCTPGPPKVDPCLMTFIMGNDGTPRVDSLNCCDDKSMFIDDGLVDGLYEDSLGRPRDDRFTICPQNQWQQLYLHFSEFGLEEGDTLYVYDGRTLTDSLLGKFSGAGVSQTGGWVASSCSPQKNPSSCLTFQFVTDGDNNKGIGWKGNFECKERDIKLTPPNITPIKLTCTQTMASFTIEPATMKAACGTIQDSQIVRVYNEHSMICKDTCLAPGETFIDKFTIGQYRVEYKLKSDTVKTAETVFSVQGAAHVCNDVVRVPIGSGCTVLVTPDDVLEGPCDTISDTLYYFISIIGKDKNGKETVIATGGGRGGNYPMLTKEQFEKFGGNLDIEIERRHYEGLTLSGLCNNGTKTIKCRTKMEIFDNSGPVFSGVTRDTFKVCDIDLTEKGLGLTKPKAFDNCSEAKVTFTGVTVLNDGGICDTTRALVNWTAEDSIGNKATITQNIVLIRADTADLVLPKDTRLSCGFDTEATFNDLKKVGVPSLKIGQVKNGKLVPSDTVALSTEKYICGYILQKREVRLSSDCGQKLYRYWDITDWCNPNFGPMPIDTQFIELVDTLAPKFTLDSLPFRNLDLDHFACTLDANKLDKPIATDNCSAVSVRLDSVFRIENGELWGVPTGTIAQLDCDSFQLRYVAEDACHEQLKNDTITQNIFIRDVTKPSVVCIDTINVSIGTDKARLPLSAFDKGSYDACGLEKLEVSRDGKTWSDHVVFDCKDVHGRIKVHLRATDKKGNQNTCWSIVIVEDKLAPICGDLPDQKGTCDAQQTEVFGPSTDTDGDSQMEDSEWTNMTEAQLLFYNTNYGYPNCSDNAGDCGALILEQQYQLIPWPCGMLEIKRRYRAIDWMGEGNKSNWEEQNIKIEYRADWSVTFPADWTGECGATIPTSEPIITNGKCDLIGFEVEEKTFVTDEEACLKVVRTFTVINWCTYEAGMPTKTISRVEGAHGLVTQPLTITAAGNETVGKLQYVQILKVRDTEAPVVTIEAPADQCINGIDSDAPPFAVEDVTPGTAPYECDEPKTWRATAQDCAGDEHITWVGKLFENGVLVKEVTTDSLTYVVKNKHQYKAEFWAYDGCGNSGGAETEEKPFWDCKKPTPYCIHGVAVELMMNGSVQIWATDLDRGSYDNCTNADKLLKKLYHVSLGNRPSNIAEVHALPEQITFNCGYLGTQNVDLYIIDEENNWDYCSTYVNVQDNMNACQNGEAQAGLATIEGTVMDWNGQTVEDVMVQTNTDKSIMTSANGTYHFDFPMEGQYDIMPSKNDQPLNGVSTFDLVLISKHILGIEPFDNPYQLIAADINQSGTVTAFDMMQLRRLILNLDTEFTNNTSWKFVDAQYEFTTNDPINEAYPTQASVDKLAKDMRMDFTAIKIGDVSGNARTNSLQPVEGRTNRNTFDVSVQDQIVEAGQRYEVVFETQQLANIEGYQFTLVMGNLQFERLTNGVTSIDNFGLHRLSEGYITTSWDTNQRSADERTVVTTTLFALTFTATENGRLSEQLNLTARPTDIVAYTATGEVLDVQLTFEAPITVGATFELFQNEPNPFHEQTNIRFFLPEQSDVTLTVRDEVGRLVKMQTGTHDAGMQNIQLDNTELPTGLLYYQLETAFGTQTKKMLRVE